MRFPKEAYEHERPTAVFEDLLRVLPESDRDAWRQRWNHAKSAEQVMRDYNRAYDDSLLTITRAGQ